MQGQAESLSYYNRGVAGATEKLEAAFAEWLGVPGAVATGFGRGALWLALQVALEGKRGAQVLVPEFVCAQVPEAVRRAGGVPAFFPVQRDLTVREMDLEACITAQTAAVILVHYYGRVLAGTERLVELCRGRRVMVIEDCALALGARANGLLAGRFGDFATFSFTKSDWCYGGGMVATPDRAWAERLRALRDEGCHAAARLAFFYGMLRRADVAANHPGASRSAGGAGRWLEDGLAWLEPTLAGNFFDAGRFDARMPEFAARRALRILRDLEASVARRRAMLPRLYSALRSQIPGAAEGLRLFAGRESLDAGDNGSFLLLCADDGDAAGLVERADAVGCALRLSWPAYQRAEAAHHGHAAWLGRHLLIVESPAA